MSEASAVRPQMVGENFPETTMTLDEVIVAIQETEQRFMRLYQRFNALNNTTEVEDKRLVFNPSRNLKIAANRSYQWARRAGCDADEARERALAATVKSAHDYYPQSIVEGILPMDVLGYIDLLHSEYNMTEVQKKASRKLDRKKKNDN